MSNLKNRIGELARTSPEFRADLDSLARTAAPAPAQFFAEVKAWAEATVKVLPKMTRGREDMKKLADKAAKYLVAMSKMGKVVKGLGLEGVDKFDADGFVSWATDDLMAAQRSLQNGDITGSKNHLDELVFQMDNLLRLMRRTGKTAAGKDEAAYFMRERAKLAKGIAAIKAAQASLHEFATEAFNLSETLGNYRGFYDETGRRTPNLRAFAEMQRLTKHATQELDAFSDYHSSAFRELAFAQDALKNAAARLLELADVAGDVDSIETDDERSRRYQASGSKTAGPSIPKLTARQWELYSTVPGNGQAAERLNAALKDTIIALGAALTRAKIARDAEGFITKASKKTVDAILLSTYRKHMEPAMVADKAFGATDSEPRYHALMAISNAARQLLDDSYLDFSNVW